MRDELGPFLSDVLGHPVTVEGISRISVGHSRAMYRVGLSDGQRVILRREQGGVFGSSSAEEYRVMGALFRLGFPVAEVIAYDPTGTVLGQPFFVMKELAAARPGVDERKIDEATARHFVRTIARLHAIDPATLPFDSQPTGPADANHLQIDRWFGIYRNAVAGSAPVPLIHDAARWLHAHAPVPERLATVHGDAGPANFVHSDGRVVAITDWEFAHAGDPTEDWVFCLAMRGVTTMPRERWLELFAEEAGVHLDPEEVAWWEVFNLFKGACANRTTLTIFEAGTNRNPNMAIIGTTLHQHFLQRLARIIPAS
jgi:aminoglycoside phosphotransferase (APT) family kinase protein